MIPAKPTAQALAQQHVWKSWFWGLGLAIGLRAFWVLVAAVQESGKGWYAMFTGSKSWLLLVAMCLPEVAIALGVPSLLGAFVRRRGMEWAFATAVSPASLVWRTVLVVEGSVLLLLLVYLLPVFFIGSGPGPNDVAIAVRLFFGLSLPWLVSSVLVALRLRPGRIPESTNETAFALTDSAE